jgi:restriction system-associated AAA family ATPase
MKLHRIKLNAIENRPLLNGVDLSFTDDNDLSNIDPNCFIGINGSGKSQLLETIADIFFYLDRIFRKINRVIEPNAPCLFELEYSFTKSNQKYIVKVIQEKSRGTAPAVLLFDVNYNELELVLDDIESYLPQKIIGYTSGENETLSIPFLDYYDEYADHTASRALPEKNSSKKGIVEDYDPRFYLMDYSTNKGVVIANLISGNNRKVKLLLDSISITGIRNFQLKIQTKHKAAKGKDGIKLTPELEATVKNLKIAAAAYDYDASINAHTFDFYNNDATRKVISKYFGSSIDFYTALYKLELLNNLIIDKKYRNEIKKTRRQKSLVIKPPTVSEMDKVFSYSEIKLFLNNQSLIDYINLSDGEHQFLNIFGTILMQDTPNSIFLLDEPETHFNPKWRREFVKLWNALAAGRTQDNFITTHSPFLVSDCKREKVFIFKKENETLQISLPTKETFGASFDYILMSAFGLEYTTSEKSLKDLKDLIKSDDIESIEKGLSNFGESPEKFYLYKRIEELRENTKDDAPNL